MGRSSAKSHSSLWKCTSKKYSRQTAFGFWSILCKKSRQRPEMYPEKTFRPDKLRLPFPTDREAPQATRCDNPKKYSSRLPSAFGSILSKKPLQPSEIYPEKTFRPDNLRLPFPTDREAPQVARCDNPKKYSSGQPSALGRSSPKSHSSLRNCALKRCSGQAASSFGSIPCEKPLQPLEMYPEKIFPPDSLRLWVDTLRKVPPAFGIVL